MTNKQYYDAFRAVPKEAQKTIGAGKLKGFTDVNPMWRIKMLTETFGPVGFGWVADIDEIWTESAAGESVAWVRCSLKVKDPGSGEWSLPIHGIGGSKQNGKGQGEGINDEAFKMAYTDAISVACKSLGMCADIYFAGDAKDNRTKYDAASDKAAPVCDDETYWGIVRAYGDGRPTKTGGDYRETWISTYKPTADQVKKFDHDVDNYRVAKSGGEL